MLARHVCVLPSTLKGFSTVSISPLHRLLVGAALILLGIVANVAVRSCTPEDVAMDMSPTEVALGTAIGTWLREQGAADVVILETRWALPHLTRLEDARHHGLERALGSIPHRFVRAEGPEGRAAAWLEALDQCSPTTVLVSGFGMPAKVPFPAVGAGLVLVLAADGGGRPRQPVPLPHRIISPRELPLAPVGDPAWSGTDAQRFDAYYVATDHPAAKVKKP